MSVYAILRAFNESLSVNNVSATHRSRLRALDDLPLTKKAGRGVGLRFSHDAVSVTGDSSWADPQLQGDFSVSLPCGEQIQNFPLARRKLQDALHDLFPMV